LFSGIVLVGRGEEVEMAAKPSIQDAWTQDKDFSQYDIRILN
jgi:hypothetical protein